MSSTSELTSMYRIEREKPWINLSAIRIGLPPQTSKAFESTECRSETGRREHTEGKTRGCAGKTSETGLGGGFRNAMPRKRIHVLTRMIVGICVHLCACAGSRRYSSTFSSMEMKKKEKKNRETVPEESKGVVLVAAGVFTREWMTPRGHQRTPTVGYAFVDGGVLGMRCRQTSDNRWKRGGWFSRGELTPKLGQQTSEVPLTGATHLPKWGTSGNDSSGMFMECVRNNDAVRHSLQL